MIFNLKQLKEAAVDLPNEERAELALFLVDSLNEKANDDVRAEWIAVAKQRLTELQTGSVTGIPAEQVLQNLLKPRT